VPADGASPTAPARATSALRLERIVSPDGGIEVELAPEAGGRLHRLRVDGRDLLRTPDDPLDDLRDPLFWGGYPMAPWCNRLAPGVLDVGGRRVVLAASFRDRTAMHGEVYRRPWQVVGPGRLAVRGGGERERWPWAYEVTLGVAATDHAVRIAMALTNAADEPMPGGIGIHPWFLRPIDVAIGADAVYHSNAPSPVEPEAVQGPYDLRHLAPMPLGLDATWTRVSDPAVDLSWPDSGLAASMVVRAPSVLICVANPSDVPATAIEPQTHAPQGLDRLLTGAPDGMSWIAPGESLTLDVDLTFRRA
jgi:aldose 1-epimerase